MTRQPFTPAPTRFDATPAGRAAEPDRAFEAAVRWFLAVSRAALCDAA